MQKPFTEGCRAKEVMVLVRFEHDWRIMSGSYFFTKPRISMHQAEILFSSLNIGFGIAFASLQNHFFAERKKQEVKSDDNTPKDAERCPFYRP